MEELKKIDEYLRIADAAEVLGIKTHTLRRWTNNGGIPSIKNKFNGQRLYKREDLEKALREMHGA